MVRLGDVNGLSKLFVSVIQSPAALQLTAAQELHGSSAVPSATSSPLTCSSLWYVLQETLQAEGTVLGLSNHLLFPGLPFKVS